MTDRGFAVIDLETTGFFSRGNDRIVEIAIVHADERGRVTGRFETLVNPGRDLGPQRIHRIRARDVLDAPTFSQIAAQVVDLLRGRVIVAHNASFDIPFLFDELARAGYEPWLNPVSLCTMRLARDILPGAGRSLRDCCDAFDIDNPDAHRASADAFATAQLLEAYLASTSHWPLWQQRLEDAADVDWPPVDLAGSEWMPRPDSDAPAEPHFLERITIKLPEHAGPAEHTEYLALLDRALLDRQLSVHETRALIAMAEERCISRPTVESLHLSYFASVVAVAWADGVLTDSERDDVEAVGALLRIPADVVVDAATPPATLDSTPATVEPTAFEVAEFALARGDLIVLTGEMSRPRAEWDRDLAFHGFTTWNAVTKKVRLVAAADPDSLSGKAKKARDYGIPVVGESWLLERWPSCH